jgi:hypothetical protein
MLILLGTASEQDSCMDQVGLPCDRRSTVEKRDACRIGKRECSTVENKSKRDECWNLYGTPLPSTPSDPYPAPEPVQPVQPVQPVSSPTWQDNALGGSCITDEDCFNQGACGRIVQNIKHDECYYKKQNKFCDAMSG